MSNVSPFNLLDHQLLKKDGNDEQKKMLAGLLLGLSPLKLKLDNFEVTLTGTNFV